MPGPQLHSLTIDVEDWYHVCQAGEQLEVPRRAWRVRHATDKILALLAQHGALATFFMLGSVAEAEPELARLIVAQGHEVASHGWSHRLLHDLTPAVFEEELARTEDILLDQTGRRPLGFRAPRWSLSKRTPWAFPILARRGYLYDSSCNPLPFLAGNRAPRHPYRVVTEQGGMWELPPMVSVTPVVHLPTGGGWGFRFFPQNLIVRTVARYEREGRPAVLFLHPREVDPEGPRAPMSLARSFVTYGSRQDAAPRIETLLQRFRFTTLADLVGRWTPAS